VTVQNSLILAFKYAWKKANCDDLKESSLCKYALFFFSRQKHRQRGREKVREAPQ